MQLIKEKEAIELEVDAITAELTSPGINGEPPVGISAPLVDVRSRLYFMLLLLLLLLLLSLLLLLLLLFQI